jgi:hypothetical protein
MTKEERAERIRDRALKDAAAMAQFPEVMFNISMEGPNDYKNYVQIWLRKGEPHFITVRKPKDAKWCEDIRFPNMELLSMNLGRYMPGLAALICGLVLRYNALAEQANTEAAKIPVMKLLSSIPTESLSHP